MENLRPRAAGWIIGRRRPIPKQMTFESGVILELPDFIRGNNGINQDYRIVDVLAVAENMVGYEELKPGVACILHELDSLPLDPTGDKDLITFGGLVVQAILEQVEVSD